MKTVIETIENRRSVRTFTEQDVSKQDIETLLKAAMCAPSSKNNQPWSFYVIRNRGIMQQLADSLPFAKMLVHAPLAIIVCGDNTKGVSEPDQALNWALDCSAATQNLLLAAESLGLAGVWTGVFPYSARVKAVQSILQLPGHIMPLNVVPIGYAGGDEKPKNKFKPENINWID